MPTKPAAGSYRTFESAVTVAVPLPGAPISAIVRVPPSGSKSLASTSMSTGCPEVVTAVSLPAAGASFTGMTSTKTSPSSHRPLGSQTEYRNESSPK